MKSKQLEENDSSVSRKRTFSSRDGDKHYGENPSSDLLADVLECKQLNSEYIPFQKHHFTSSRLSSVNNN